MNSPDSHTRPERIPRALTAALVAGGVLLVTMVVLLALTLSEIRTSRVNIEATDAKIAALLEVSEPALEAAAPVAEDAAPLLDDAQPVLQTLSSSLPSILSAGRTLRPTLDRLPAFVIAGQHLIGEAIPALAVIEESRIPETLAAARDLVSRAQAPELLQALSRAQLLIDQAVALRLPERAVRAAKRVQRLLATQLRTLAVQKRSFAVQKRSLEIQRKTLGHVRSLDNRTGGTLPPPLGLKPN